MDNIALKLTEVEGRSKSNSHRIDSLELEQSAIMKLATAVEVMANEQKHQTTALGTIKDEVSKLDTKVEALEKVPGERWKAAIGVVIAVVVAYLLGLLGVS